LVAIIRAVSAVVWSILMITSSLVLMLFTWNPKLSVAQARHMWAPGILWICGIKLEVSGTENLDKSKPYVFVANHQSYLDIPFLFRAIPVNLYFIAKKEVKMIPFVGWYMMATGMIFIDRSNRAKSIASLDRSAKLIHNGKSVILFPEGTRSRDGYLANFKKGPFVLASKADVQIAPVGIQEAGKKFELNRLGKTHIKINIGVPSFIGHTPLADWIVEVHDEVAELSGRTKSVQA